MSPELISIVGLLLLLLSLALGVHIGISLTLVALLGMSLLMGLDRAVIIAVHSFFSPAMEWTFVALPMFILMGLLAAGGGISQRTYDTMVKWLHWLPGGLGIATVGACAAFGTVTGSSLATAMVFARVSAPEMCRRGYDRKFAYGITSSAGTLGMLIPPSLLAVFYALITEESLGKILLAGIGPALVLAVSFSVGIMVMVKLNPALAPGVSQPVSWRERLLSTWSLWAVALVAAIVIGGIYTGVFTPTEAGAVAVVVILLIGLVVRQLNRVLMGGILRETVALTAMIFLLLGGAKVFSRFLALSGLTSRTADLVTSLNLTPFGLVIISAIVFLVMGTLLDSVSMLAIAIPVLYPVVKAMGIDPIWYAMVVIFAIHVGAVTPPVGLNVYAVKGVAGDEISLEDLFRGVSPFFLMMLAAFLIVIAFPAISTWLPAQMG